MPRFPQSLEERFWSKVRKGPGCWEWTASRCGPSKLQYGQFWMDSSRQRAHRVSWSFKHGEIPKGMFVCHSCDNPLCVRPDHLWLGTNSDNQKDSVAKAGWANQNSEKTKCVHGHQFTAQNTVITKLGRRRCRICQLKHGREKKS